MRILFQGDSITDAGSYRKKCSEFTGYVKYTAELLGGGNDYFNHGISGNTSADVLARYEKDIKAVEPDVMTLLIGINDVWRAFDSCHYTSPDSYGKSVREILTKTRKDFPNVKIILLEPFLLPAPDKKYWRGNLAEYIEEARAAAVELADGFVPLDGLLAKERMTTAWQELSGDGVHLAEKGQRVVAKYLAEEIRRVAKI